LAAGKCRSFWEIRKIEQTTSISTMPSRGPVTTSSRVGNSWRKGATTNGKAHGRGRLSRSAIDRIKTDRSESMMKITKIALVVASAMFVTPAAMAHPHSAHAHLTGSHMTKTVRDPGYARSGRVGPDWGSECVTDEGQGRFFPCDSGP
jgi:hypothetical protein